MKKLTVLHIEDEASIARLTARHLAQNPAQPSEVLWADTLAKGLAILGDREVDIILLDLILPDSQDVQTLDQVRAAAMEVPIVVITGIADEDLYESVLGHGAQEYLAKEDLKPQTLLRAMRFAMERKRSETRMLQDRSELERRVVNRTRELQETNQRLRAEIEERRKIEEVLRQSDEQNRNLLDSLPLSLAVYDLRGRLVFLNAAFSKTFGWNREEMIGRKLDFVPQERLAELLPRIELMKQGLPVEPFETVRYKQDGSRLEVRISTAPYRDSTGELVGNIVTFRDITTLKQAEQRRAETEGRYQMLVETMSEGLVEVDPEFRLTFFNQSFARMLGYPPEELLNRRTIDMLTEPSRQAMEGQWERRRLGHEGSYEVAWHRKDGSLAFSLVSGKPRFDDQGNFKGSIALITNITERKILEGQLLQAQKLEAIGQLAAGIAHEINTPTQYVSDNTRFLGEAFTDVTKALLAYLQLAKALAPQGAANPALAQTLQEAEAVYQEIDGDYLLAEVPKAIEQTMEGLNRISTIVRSMKEFAHPGPETKTATDLNHAIENTITVAKNEWKYVAEVATDLDPDLPLVPCVPGEVNQVLLNIIVNAAHAIADVVKEGQDQKGLIKIATRQTGNEVEISISDSGPGVPAAIRNRIFDPFFTTKPPGKGTGQGLAIAYRVIVDKHGGKLSVDSTEGQGTTFKISLPLQDSNRGDPRR